jgi:hypothetical protein
LANSTPPRGRPPECAAETHVTEGTLGLADRAVFSPINGRSIRRAVNALRRKPGITWFNRHCNARTGLVEEFQVAGGRLTFCRPSFSHQLGVPGRKAFLGVSLSAVNGLEHGAQQITRDDPSGAEWRMCIPTSMAGHARKIRKAKHHVHSVVGDAKDCMPAGLQAALLFFQRRIPPRLLQRKRPQSASLLPALRTPHPFRDFFQASIPAAKPSQCVRLRLSLVTTFRTFEHESVLTKLIAQFVDMKSGRHT